MNNPGSDGEKVTPNFLLRHPADMLIWALIGIQLLIAIGAYPFLPAVVPVHYGFDGQANGYGPKWIATFLFPVLSIVIWLVGVRQIMGPRLGERAQEASNIRLRSVLFIGTILFLLIIQIATTAQALGMKVDLPFLLNLGLAVLFIFIGNYMGKLRRNFWMGIRTPWTLASEVAWERTHRVGGWLFVACGLLCLPLSLVPAFRLWIILPLLLLVSVFLFIYSYLCYRQQTENERDERPLPFDESGEDQ